MPTRSTPELIRQGRVILDELAVVAGRDPRSITVLAIGTRLHQQSTAGFTLPHADQVVIQIDPAEEVIGQNHRPTVGIVTDVKLALSAALAYPASTPHASRQGWIDEYRKVQQDWATPPERPTSKVSMEKVMMDMKTTLPPDAIVDTHEVLDRGYLGTSWDKARLGKGLKEFSIT